MKVKISTLLYFLLLGNLVLYSQKPVDFQMVTEEFIYDQAAFPSAHASTIENLADGRLIAAWFGGTHERHPDVSIYTSTRDANGWSKPKKVADGVQNDSLRYPTWNPVLFNTEEKLFLFYKIGPSPSTWWGAYKTSLDEGKTWSEAQLLPQGILGPVKNKPIQLASGRIISPSSIELEDGKIWHAHMEISDDEGKTWRKVPVNHNAPYKVIQPSLVTLENGDLKAFFRSDQDVVLESVSRDKGEHWSAFQKSELPNPNSGIDALSLKNGGYLMVYNPLPAGAQWSDGRNKLNLAFSKDTKQWRDVLVLEKEQKGEFSYPAIVQDAAGFIHITYTYNREKIKYLELKRVPKK